MNQDFWKAWLKEEDQAKRVTKLLEIPQFQGGDNVHHYAILSDVQLNLLLEELVLTIKDAMVQEAKKKVLDGLLG